MSSQVSFFRAFHLVYFYLQNRGAPRGVFWDVHPVFVGLELRKSWRRFKWWREKTKQHLWRVIVLVEDKDADIDIRVE